MAIVLVILGLLVGGILSGQALIKASEHRSVIKEFQSFQTAVLTFEDQYDALPGDLKNAIDYWGAINTTHGTCIVTASNDKKKTCNGNGDGYINKLTFYTPDGYERYHFWLHLSNAGMIEGQFNGLTSTSGAFGWNYGVNVPRSGLNNSGWDAASVFTDATSGSDTNWFARNYKYKVFLQMVSPEKLLLPRELRNLDRKIDDGSPASGNVMTFKNTSSWEPGCATSDALTAEYNVSSTNKVCMFRGGF